MLGPSSLMVRRVFPAKWTTTPPDPGTPADQLPESLQFAVVALPPVQVVGGAAAKPDRLARTVAPSAMRVVVNREVLFMFISRVAHATSDRKAGTKLLLSPELVSAAACQILEWGYALHAC